MFYIELFSLFLAFIIYGTNILTYRVMKNRLIYFAFISIFLISCADKKKSNVQQYVAAFLAEDDKAVGYGYFSLGQLIEKSDLLNFPVVGRIVSQEMGLFNESIGTDVPLYYTVEGPLDRNGTPNRSYLFMQVKNQDSLKAMFAKMGYFFEEEKGISYSGDMNMGLGYRDDLAIIVSAGFDDDIKSMVYDAFERVKGKASNNKINDILAKETDILFASHLENLYGTSNTELEQLPIQKQETIKKLAKHSHFVTTLDFNDGEIVFQTFSEVNDDLKEALFLNDNVEGNAAKKLGPGSPFIAYSMELDIPKMERLMSEFYPEATKQMYKSMGSTGMILKAVGGEGLNKLINGKMGVAVTSVPKDIQFEGIPSFNMYAGIGKSGSAIVDLLMDLAESGEIEKVEKGYYKYDIAEIRITSEEISLRATASDDESSDEKNQALKFPKGAENFGKKPISLFIDFKKLHDADINMDEEARAILELFDYAYMEADNSCSSLTIKMKDMNKNVIQQVLERMRGEIEMMMSTGVSI